VYKSFLVWREHILNPVAEDQNSTYKNTYYANLNHFRHVQLVLSMPHAAKCCTDTDLCTINTFLNLFPAYKNIKFNVYITLKISVCLFFFILL
jgi:hypothetical protein